MNNYPQLGHFGFKILVCIWGFNSMIYMRNTEIQRDTHNRLLAALLEKMR